MTMHRWLFSLACRFRRFVAAGPPTSLEEKFEQAYQDALQFAQKIEDERFYSLVLSDIASALAKAGQFDQAVEVAEGIEKPNERLQALAAIVAAKREKEK